MKLHEIFHPENKNLLKPEHEFTPVEREQFRKLIKREMSNWRVGIEKATRHTSEFKNNIQNGTGSVNTIEVPDITPNKLEGIINHVSELFGPPEGITPQELQKLISEPPNEVCKRVQWKYLSKDGTVFLRFELQIMQCPSGPDKYRGIFFPPRPSVEPSYYGK